MKKLKFLPSIMMLVLCFGILAVGIYAANPHVNNVTGTVTVNASNAEISVTLKDSSDKTLDSSSGRTHNELSLGAIVFDTEEANDVSEVEAKVYTLEFSTKSETKFVIDTPTIELLDGTTASGASAEDIIVATKKHEYTSTYNDLACFTKDEPYTITLTLRLGHLSEEEVNLDLDFVFNVYKASEYVGGGIEGVDYLTFGEYPQTLVSDITESSLEGTGETIVIDFAVNDEAPIYKDSSNNRYVLKNENYYLIEPLKWRILDDEENGTLVMSETVMYMDTWGPSYDLEPQYLFMNNYLYDFAFSEVGKGLINERLGNKLFMLSAEDMTNATYGFCSDYNFVSISRILKASDYFGGGLTEQDVYSLCDEPSVTTPEEWAQYGFPASTVVGYEEGTDLLELFYALVGSANYWTCSEGSGLDEFGVPGAIAVQHGELKEVAAWDSLGCVPAMYIDL